MQSNRQESRSCRGNEAARTGSPLFRELRDPHLFRDAGKTYLLYSVAGERGIAGAVVND